jgi:type I restriction enzyme S subunit
MVPKGWASGTLGDGITLLSGQHIEAQDVNLDGKGIPYLTGPADFPDGKFVVTKFTEFAKVCCECGDHLITVKGSGTGKVITSDGAYCISRQLMAVRASSLESSFTFYLLQKNLSRYESAAGGLIPGISRGDVLDTPIKIPPYKEQKKIAQIISTWDKAITTTEKLLANSQQQKKALMQQLLTGKKRLLDGNGVRFKGAWKWLKASELFKTVSKKNNSESEELLSVTQDQGVLPRSLLERKVVMPDGSTNGYKLVVPGNFIISLRSFQGGLEYSSYRGLVSPAYTVLEPIKDIDDGFYKQYFKSYDFIGHLAVAVIGIRDGKQISYEDFSFLKLPYPSLDEQQKIASALNASDQEVSILQERLTVLRNEKKALMQQLLTGKRRVKVEEAA